jgi:hypothetical protein
MSRCVKRCYLALSLDSIGRMGMRRARLTAAVALLVTLATAWVATARIDREPVDRLGPTVESSQIGRRRLGAAYLHAIGTAAYSTRRSGGTRCVGGSAGERTWSRPAHPRRVVGRFACRVEHGRAAMWWTDADRGVLVHAVAPDDDLASLFAWWLSHSER